MATRPWDPVTDLGDATSGGAIVGMWDVLATSTLTFNEAKTGVTRVASLAGSLALVPGSSGTPRYQALNGGYALYGAVDYAYFLLSGVSLPSGSAATTLVFVGKGVGSYAPSFALRDANSKFYKTIGTAAGTGRIGSPATGNDLVGSGALYGSSGNAVICQWDASSTVNQTLFADGTQLGSRTRTDLAGLTLSQLALLQNSNASTDTGVDFFQCAMVLNRLLATDERQRLEGWLAWRYNLVSQLQASHPYKAAAPTVDTGGGATYTGAISLGANPAQITASLLSGVSAVALAASAACGCTCGAVYSSAAALAATAGVAGTLAATLPASDALASLGGVSATATAAASAALAVAASMAQGGASSLSATAALSITQTAGLTDAGVITAAQAAALAVALSQGASSGGAAYASAMQIAAAAAMAMAGANVQAASSALPVAAGVSGVGTGAYVGGATLAGIAGQGASVQAIAVAAAALAEAFGVNAGTGGAQSYAGAVALAVTALNAANAASAISARAALAATPSVQTAGATTSVAAASLATVADEAARAALTITAGASFRASTQAFAAGSVVVSGALSLPSVAGLAPQAGGAVAASVAFTAHFDATAVASITAAEVAQFAAQAALQAVLQVGDLYAGAPQLRGVRTLTLTLEGRRMGTRTLAGTVRLTFGPSGTSRQ